MRKRIKALTKSAEGFWSDHPAVDYVSVLVIVGAHFAVILTTGRGDVLGWIDSPQRQVLYEAGSGVVAVIGGLGSLALAVYQALNGDRARAVKRLYANELRRNWLAVITTTGVAAAGCLAALALDRPPDDPLYGRFVFEVAIALSATRFIRLTWLFNVMLKVEGAEANDEPIREAPPLSDQWAQSASVPVPR